MGFHTLVVRFSGGELGSVSCVMQQSCRRGCGRPLDDLDVAWMCVRLSLKRSSVGFALRPSVRVRTRPTALLLLNRYGARYCCSSWFL